MNAVRDRNQPERRRPSARKVLRWVAIVVAVLFFGNILFEALFPFRGQEYIEISHGDHSHYLPKEVGENVNVSAFPTRPPGPDERITIDGRIVPKEQ